MTFILLLFQYINVLFPDVLVYDRISLLDSVRWSTASLIVIYPVYVLTLWLIHRDLRADPAKADIWIRRWLTYLTLFLAAIAIIVDLVTLIYNFLNGELTASFTLKILVVLLVVCAVFGYYLWDLRRRSFLPNAVSRTFAWTAATVIIISLVAGFFLVGSPFSQRQVRIDQRRINDLQVLQNEIVNYWTQKTKIPSKLDDLKNDISGFTAPVDPVTGQPYEYVVKGKLSFELCANFSTQSLDERKGVPAPIPYREPYMQNWSHPAGWTCFTRTIDPEIYRPTKPVVAPL